MELIRSSADSFEDNQAVNQRAEKLNQRYTKIQETADDVEGKLSENAEVTCFLPGFQK